MLEKPQEELQEERKDGNTEDSAGMRTCWYAGRCIDEEEEGEERPEGD